MMLVGKSSESSLYRLALLVFVVIFIAAQQYLLFARVGVQYGGDTSRYLAGSEALLNGQPLRAEQPAYVGYIVFFAAARALGLGEVGMVELQIALSVLVLLSLYAAASALADERAGLLTAVLYGINWDVLNWNFYILTDGVYISALTLAAMLAVIAGVRHRRGAAILAGFFTLFAGVLRPGGIVPVTVLAAFFVLTLPRRTSPLRRWGAFLLAGVAVFLVLYFPTRARMNSIDPMDLIARGEVVWEVDAWRLDMPAPKPESPGGLRGVVQYCLAHPGPCANLLARRVGVYFLHMRAEYSLRHNLMIALFYFPMYLLAAGGLWYHRAQVEARLVAALIAAHAAFFALAVPSVDGRFFAYIVPLITFAAALGASALWKHLRPVTH